ncbi:MAG: hypothetical protein EBX37_11840 [Alphaproteobacteria bacterium]|nr:hypothetical protein [Alphaproteobacteria bacterium]
MIKKFLIFFLGIILLQNYPQNIFLIMNSGTPQKKLKEKLLNTSFKEWMMMVSSLFSLKGSGSGLIPMVSFPERSTSLF